MSGKEDDIRVRPGRVRNTPSPRVKSFINQVLRAAQTSRLPSGRKGHGSSISQSNFGRGRTRYARDRLFSSTRRVVVKARIVRHRTRSHRSAPLSAHIGYLKRDGVTRDGNRGVLFDATSDRANDRAFAMRCEDDRHHFRFMVSPEDAAELEDLKAFTRDLAGQMEADLETKLDWIAVDHWNTDNPHIHLLVRGVDQTGTDLVISRDYISQGLRSRGEELVSLELGPKSEQDIRGKLEKDITAERWTGLDREIRFAADDVGAIDLRPDVIDKTDRAIRRLMIGRLRYLEKLGLAAKTRPGEWTIALEAESRLRDLGMRGDVIKTMHQAFHRMGQERSVTDFAIGPGTSDTLTIGRLVETGLQDELTGEAYAIIDGVDGRVHHVRFPGIHAFEHAPSTGGIVEVRHLPSEAGRDTRLVLALRSDADLKSQVTADGATWLDHRLVEQRPMPIALSGFGREVRDALTARKDYLVTKGFAQRQGQRVLLQRNLLNTLRRRDVTEAARKLSRETGLTYKETRSGDHVAGTYRKRVTLSSGRYTIIEGCPGFQLVPWTPALEKRLGQEVSGRVRDGGGIDWGFARKRGMEL